MEIKHIKKVVDKLKEKNGAGVIEVAIIFLFSMLLLSVATEFIRVQITAGNIKDSFERALLTVASENYNEVYAGFREENYIGGEYEGGPAGGGDLQEVPQWVPLNDYGNVEEELLELLNLEESEKTLISVKDDYQLSNIEIQVNNAEYATSGKYEMKGTIKIKIPLYFSGVKMVDVDIPITVFTAYTPKY